MRIVEPDQKQCAILLWLTLYIYKENSKYRSSVSNQTDVHNEDYLIYVYCIVCCIFMRKSFSFFCAFSNFSADTLSLTAVSDRILVQNKWMFV